MAPGWPRCAVAGDRAGQAVPAATTGGQPRRPRPRRDSRDAARNVAAISVWFRPDVRGLHHIPAKGPALIVGNHTGGILSPEVLISQPRGHLVLRCAAPVLSTRPPHGAQLAARPDAAQVRHRRGRPGERPHRPRRRRSAAGVPGRRLRGVPAHVTIGAGRLRPPQRASCGWPSNTMCRSCRR